MANRDMMKDPWRRKVKKAFKKHETAIFRKNIKTKIIHLVGCNLYYLFTVQLKDLKVFIYTSTLSERAFSDDMNEIVGQHEWHAFAANEKFVLEMAHYVSEIDVKKLTVRPNHNVVRVPVTDAQNVGGNTVAGTR